jgi:outer membrane receptor protein involved in Fe transport
VRVARRLAPLSLVAFLAATLPGEGIAQTPADSTVSESPPSETATLRGTVASRIDGRGVSGARVLLPELSRGGITEPDGTFEIADLPPGSYDVQVRYFNYSTNERPVQLRAGHVTRATFLLEQDVLEVAELVVEVRRPPSQPEIWMADFRRRRAEGFGHFVTREDIEEKRPRRASDLFRQIPGLFVTAAGFEGSKLYLRRGARQCEPALWVDGVLTGRYPIDDLHPDDIEGIEVYRRPSETPLQFQRGSCGSVLIWTRSGADDRTDGGF